MLLCRMEPCHLVNLLTRQLSLKNIQTMKYSYYQNKKQPPCAEVTDEEVANLIRHDEKLAHMTLDIRQHITANDIATADSIKGELPSVTFSARLDADTTNSVSTTEKSSSTSTRNPPKNWHASQRQSPEIRIPTSALPVRRATVTN